MGIVLSNIIAIYRRELQSYFASPFAYIIAGLFWLVSGFLFVLILFSSEGVIAQVAVQDQMGITNVPIDVAYQFLTIFLGVLGSVALFVLPILSMGLYSEERKRGTIELLATSPITNWAVALGKLLGVVTLFTTLVLPLMIYQAIALSAANPPASPAIMLVGHFALILMGAAILSLGMFMSSLTDNTILAAILTFGLILLLWVVVDPIANAIGGPVGEALGHLSLSKNYTNLTRGIVDTSSIIVFLSYIVLGLFLTAQSIEAFRFQRN